jgi:hypothetical protein
MNENSNFEVETIQSLDSNAIDRAIEGGGLMQTKAQYTTAVQVIRKRNIDAIMLSVEKEASLAGDDFYYAWGQGAGYIEGISIVGAEILARLWGNCAVNTRVEEKGDSFIFYGDFIDFETGYNLTRPFRTSKKILFKKDGKTAIYEKERNDDIVFQIGVSKGSRNVIVHAIPRYVQDKAISKAKEGTKKLLEKMGIEKATLMIIGKATKVKVPVERIESNYGKKERWDIERLILISGALRTIEDGYGTINDVFPPEEGEKPTDDNDKSPITTDKKPEPEQPKEKEIIIEGAGVVDEKTGEIIKEEPAKNPFERGAQGFYLFEVGKIKTKEDYSDFEKTYVAEITKNFTGQKLAQVKNALAAKEKELK